MKTIRTILTSKTTYIILGVFIVGGVQAITQFMPPGIASIVESVLGVLAIFTHADSKTKLTTELQSYTGY